MKDLSLEKLTVGDIVLLEGRELDVAVCLALGYKWFVREDGKLYLCPPDKISMYMKQVKHPSKEDVEAYTLTSQYEIPPYSSDIGLAMQLDEDGWEWTMIDRYGFNDSDEINISNGTVSIYLYVEEPTIIIRSKWRTLSEKPSAYARARCMAYLKAKKMQLANSGI